MINNLIVINKDIYQNKFCKLIKNNYYKIRNQ